MDGFTLTWKRTAADSIIPIGPDAYVVPVKGSGLAARAAALSSLLPQEVVIARRTAAWIWGLDVLPPGVNELDWDVELITPRTPEAPPEPSPVTADSVEVPPEHVVKESDVRLTSPTRTALDCARWLPRYEAVAALDQFLRRDVEVDELTAMARTLRGYRGNKRLRQILRLGDRGAASPEKVGFASPSWTPGSRSLRHRSPCWARKVAGSTSASVTANFASASNTTANATTPAERPGPTTHAAETGSPKRWAGTSSPSPRAS